MLQFVWLKIFELDCQIKTNKTARNMICIQKKCFVRDEKAEGIKIQH
jgi:hypothetical protein